MRTPNDTTYNLSIPGFMRPVELRHLDGLVSTLAPGAIVVEVGSMFGRSSYCIAKSNPGVTLYCVDQWKGDVVPRYPEFTNSLTEFQKYTAACPNIITKHIEQTHVEWDGGKVDMVFIDAGCHANPIEWEIVQYWLPKIKNGGLLTGHDYHPVYPDVIANVARLENMGYRKLSPRLNSSIWSFKT